MLPDEEAFNRKMKELDVRVADDIVCYDSMGMLTAPRASWMMRAYGAKSVRVLDGTFAKWRNENRPIVSFQDENEAFTRAG